MIIRKIEKRDESSFLKLVEDLSRFNREHHDEKSKRDDYDIVIAAIRKRAIKRLEFHNNTLNILVVEMNGELIGYAIGEIYEEELTSDNGTGKIGLFDELYLNEKARGHGLGQRLLDKMIEWFRQNDIDRVKLHAYSWNEHAKEIYRKNGFSEYAVSYEKFI